MSSLIHWHEGLFLQPHHLQASQRSIFNAVWTERRLSIPFSYGVVEARLARDDLEDHRIRFDHLTAAFPSGTIIDFPHDSDLPSLDIRKAFRERPEGFIVYLALPLWLEERPNTVEFGTPHAAGQKLVFALGEREVADENTGRNKQQVQFRRFNARLLLDDADRSDMEFIPILRVKRQVDADAAGFPRPDPNFVPPTILLSGSAILLQLVRDLTSQVCATRDQLGQQLANTPLDLRSLQGAQFEHLTRLRTVHRGASLLTSLIDESTVRAGCAGRIPLFQAYLALKDLLAELSALYPGKGLADPLPYDHDDPYPPYADLDAKIRGYLGGVSGPRYRKIDFRLVEGVFTGDLFPEFFSDATGFFLSIEGDFDASQLVRLVENPDDFKLQPASFLRRALYGVKLREERNPPFELPVKARQYFYRIIPDARVWEQFKKEPSGVVHFESPEKNSFRITLYATLAVPL